jgi:hypothetical protein
MEKGFIHNMVCCCSICGLLVLYPLLVEHVASIPGSGTCQKCNKVVTTLCEVMQPCSVPPTGQKGGFYWRRDLFFTTTAFQGWRTKAVTLMDHALIAHTQCEPAMLKVLLLFGVKKMPEQIAHSGEKILYSFSNPVPVKQMASTPGS